MAKVSTNLSLDAETKKQAQAMLYDFGMDLSTAVNIFLKKLVREGRMPFTIGYEYHNAQTREIIEKAERGEDMHGPFSTVEELMEDLNADD